MNGDASEGAGGTTAAGPGYPAYALPRVFAPRNPPPQPQLAPVGVGDMGQTSALPQFQARQPPAPAPHLSKYAPAGNSLPPSSTSYYYDEGLDNYNARQWNAAAASGYYSRLPRSADEAERGDGGPAAAAGAGGGGPGYFEGDYYSGFLYADTRVRHGFLRKVMALLAISLAITTAACAVFKGVHPVRTYVYANPWTFWLALVASFVTILTLAISNTARRKHPWNLLGLLVFVLCESFLMGTITAAVNTDILLLAAAITTGVTLMCTAFAMQTRYDLTQWTGTMYVVLWALIFALLFNLFFPTRTFNIVVSAAGAVIFSLYLIYDIQLLMGGRHMFRISPDEYVFATLNLYLDVLNLFLFILRLLQSGTHQ